METNNDQNMNEDFLKNEGQQSSGMKVPNGYFEKLDSLVLSKVKTQSGVNNLVIPINKSSSTFKYVIAVAVAASLIWGAISFLSPKADSVDKVQIAEITVDDMYEYEGMNEYFLAEGFSSSELENMENIESDYISVDEAYDYIIEENYSEYLVTETF